MDNNIHGGHRERLRKRFDAVGLDGWSEHEILEFLLFNVYRQCDTNKIAHSLINTFGKLSNVLAASHEALTAVDGVGDSAAYFIRGLGATLQYINLTNTSSMRITEKNLPRFLENLFINERNECFYVIFLDSLKRIIKKQKMFEGSYSYISIDAKKIFAEALQSKAEYVIAAHNHPHGTLKPSEDDIRITEFLEKSLPLVDSKLLEHYIVCENRSIGVLEYINGCQGSKEL